MPQPPSSPLATPLPWNLVSTAYAADVAPEFETYAKFALELCDVTAGQHIVDIACGPGTLTKLALQRGCIVNALDFSPQMIEHLHERTQSPPQLHAICADGQALPYDDASFDAGFSMFGLIFFPDRHKGLLELRRVLRPGVPLVVSSWHPLHEVPAFAAVFDAMAAAMPPPADSATPPAPVPSPMSTEADIVAEFTAAGLVDISVHTVVNSLQAPDVETYFEGMTRTLAPLALMRHRLGDDWPPIQAQLRAAVIERLGEGPIQAQMPAWLTFARTPHV